MMALGRVVPILRVFDGGLADEFYLGFLGFRADWEHRFTGHLPLYRQVSRDGAVLHLSEHFGDGTPGTVVQIQVDGIVALAAELDAKDNSHCRPSLEHQPWGASLDVVDPFGNQLRFLQSH
jgi:hypothetical protein